MIAERTGLCALLVALVAYSVSFAQAAQIEKGEVFVGAAKVPYWIQFPDKAEGKVPAMIIMHGSSGVSQRFWDYATEFNKMGVAGIIIDSFGPRNIRSSVRDQMAVTSDDMAKDILAVTQALAKRDNIDNSKIGAIGFSKGAAALLHKDSMSFFNKKGDIQLALIIAMYPSCNPFRLHPKTTGKPIKVLVGAKDTYTNPTDCQQIVENYKKHGANVEIVVLPDAQHGWDAKGDFKDSKGENWSMCRFDQLWERVWVERSTQIVIEDEHGWNKVNHDRAVAKCMTRGISGGYNAKAAAKSLSLIHEYIGRYLKQ